MSYFIRKGGGSGCYVPLADNSTPEARADTNRRGIEAMDRVLAFIRRQPGLENVSLVSSAREVGVRETYRVVGEKTISERAYLDGASGEPAARARVDHLRRQVRAHGHRPPQLTVHPAPRHGASH